MEKEAEINKYKETVMVKTAEGTAVDVAGAQAQYDNCAKTILAHKEFLARILKETVAELADFSLDRIKNECLTAEPEISAEPVDRDVCVPSKAESQNTEDTTVTEGVNYFDLKFNICVPGDGKEIKLIINLESQKDNRSYPMEKRGLYYIGRLLSSQKGITFENEHYENIRKVYSIWVRSNVTKDMKNTVTVYNISEHDIIGSRKAKKEDYDLICMVMIGLGDHEEAELGSMLKMLDVLFSKNLDTNKKKELLENECGIPMKEEILAKEVATMCSLGQGIYEDGIEIGIDKGEKLRAVKSAKTMLNSGKLTIEEISLYTDLTVEEVRKLEKEMCMTA